MKCKNHSEEVAIERCSICGNWFCEDCVTVNNMKVSCNICLGQKIPNKKQTIISEVEEAPGTIQKPIEETSQRFFIKPVPQETKKKPEKIISNSEMVDGDNLSEYDREVGRLMRKAVSSQQSNRKKNQFISRQQEEEIYYKVKALIEDNPSEYDREVRRIISEVVSKEQVDIIFNDIKASSKRVLKILVGMIVVVFLLFWILLMLL